MSHSAQTPTQGLALQTLLSKVLRRLTHCGERSIALLVTATLVACGGGGGGGASSGATSPVVDSASTLSLLAGSIDSMRYGSADGTGEAARFHSVTDVAVDSTGNVFVVDRSNDTIRKITAAGVVTTLAGNAGGYGNASTDGTGAAARFKSPDGITVDSTGNVYVVDDFTLRFITPAGVVTTATQGDGVGARFIGATGVTVDSSGNVYMADNFTLRKISPARVVTTLAGTAGEKGSTDGIGAAARFNNIGDITVDNNGNLYVTDDYVVRKITPAGVVSTLAGTAGELGSTDGTGAAARFRSLRGITVDSTGNVYVADTYNATIRKITPAGVVTTVVGVAGKFGNQLGALPGLIANPISLAITGRTLYFPWNNGVAVVYNLP